MASEDTQRWIHLVRRDLGNLLVHWTRTRTEGDEVFDPPERRTSAEAVLEEILTAGFLKGGSGCIKGGHECVCFTEAPVSEVAPLFRLAEHVHDRPRYEPYGIAVTKTWLFQQGGRPVIYQAGNEYDLLPEQLQWRHCRYEPQNDIDFTWEREWRIKVDRLKLDKTKTLVLVPSHRQAFDIMYESSALMASTFDQDGNPDGYYHEPRWMAVSLDMFGVRGDAVPR